MTSIKDNVFFPNVGELDNPLLNHTFTSLWSLCLTYDPCYENAVFQVCANRILASINLDLEVLDNENNVVIHTTLAYLPLHTVSHRSEMAGLFNRGDA